MHVNRGIKQRITHKPDSNYEAVSRKSLWTFWISAAITHETDCVYNWDIDEDHYVNKQITWKHFNFSGLRWTQRLFYANVNVFLDITK